MADPREQDPNLDRLEREAERTRANLTDTVDELRSRVSETASDLQHRASPQAIKQDVKEYVSRTGRQMLHDIEQRARDNPLQAAAVGAGLAYPAWQILRSIPAPILLLGAGIALSGRGGQAGSSGRDPSARLSEAAHRGSAAIRAGARDTASQVSETASRVEATIEAGLEKVTSGIASAVHDTSDAASRAASAAASTVSHTASSSYRSASAAAAQTRGQAGEAGRYARDALAETIERYPLLVGGFGLAVGAVIAASLPKTETESRLFGETSDEFRERASEAASSGYEAAKAAGRRVYDETMHEAERQGLSSEGARETVHEVADKAKAVAGRAAGAAGLSGAAGQATGDAGNRKSDNQTRTGGRK